ncbi:MAG: hydrogenase formation protein HypD [Marinilabiliaceae bacterium]|jgi:hydrogenase expression/formation protein HypD|nr:hydrogenase formation protein HypD [Marinilabiliaceae bacterium]
MKGLEILRDRKLASALVRNIKLPGTEELVLMEVCGSHTTAVHRYGIPSLLPPGIKLVSGPGCPVCVTGIEYVDRAIGLAEDPDNIIVTYGDMIRVPGTHTNLENMRTEGADIRIISSPLESLDLAEKNRTKKIVFLAVGFETTAPGTAITIIQAADRKIDNFFIHCAHKIMPPALRALAEGDSVIDGLIAPGHVSAITGSSIYEFLPAEFSMGCVISGFEPVDILQSVSMLAAQKADNRPRVEIQYSRAVPPEGNVKAQKLMYEVFRTADQNWRGLGLIKASGLMLKDKYAMFDASGLPVKNKVISSEPGGCRCGDIMKGLIGPRECPLFGKVCSPSNPVGACMVSGEGACSAVYRYDTPVHHKS